METKIKFKKVLRKVILKAVELGFSVKKSTSLDKFFKGDLDGKNIWLSFDLTPEEQLFNVLHLIGHNIQWNMSEELRELGNKVWILPPPYIVKTLQVYEHQANCYGMEILRQCKAQDLYGWFNVKYVEDITYLTHFYITGEKSKEPVIHEGFEFKKNLVPIEIPNFTVIGTLDKTRNGIVI